MYGKECNDGDVLEMTLDFNDLSLAFKMNDEDCGKAFNIENGEYHVAITAFQKLKIELISYQKVYYKTK